LIAAGLIVKTKSPFAKGELEAPERRAGISLKGDKFFNHNELDQICQS